MEDTIAAIATAYGEGGIGIVRVSGERAKDILDRIFVLESKDKSTINDRRLEHRKMYFGHIVNPDTGEKIDEALVVYMKAPNTYTREDVAEINCHGSIISLRKTLELVLGSGARPAEEGEFTKRAFLNGRLDLSQAEAVIDLIRAKSDKSFDVAMSQLEGSLSKKIRAIRKRLLDELVNIAVNLDYPDEDIEEVNYEKMRKSLLQIDDEILKILDSADTGKVLREGFSIAIVGKPNVGKSSLMNTILKEARAIVTDVPGTTRDTIVEEISLRGLPIKLIDTAGIHKTEDKVEKIGIEKSKEAFNKADLIILVLDGSRKLSNEDFDIIEVVGERKSIVLINKSDLESVLTEGNLDELREKMPNGIFIKTSMIEERGIELIEDEIEKMVYGGKLKQRGEAFVTNVRHKNLLEKADRALKEALVSVENRDALDFVEVDVKNSYEFLGEIIGESVNESIIDEVFSRFCLGK